MWSFFSQRGLEGSSKNPKFRFFLLCQLEVHLEDIMNNFKPISRMAFFRFGEINKHYFEFFQKKNQLSFGWLLHF